MFLFSRCCRKPTHDNLRHKVFALKMVKKPQSSRKHGDRDRDCLNSPLARRVSGKLAMSEIPAELQLHIVVIGKDAASIPWVRA